MEIIAPRIAETMPNLRTLMVLSLVVSALVVAGASGVAGCSRTDGSETLVTATSHPLAVMATSCTLTVVVPRDQPTVAQQALVQAEKTLRRVEALMSAHRDDSEIRRLNTASAKQRVPLSAETLEVLRAARRFADLSDGAFDATAAPLFRLWKQGTRQGRLPTRDALTAARSASNWAAFELLDNGAVKANSLAEVDLGGIAKGYAIDRAIATMKQAGCVGGLVDVGGDIRCFGTKPGGRPWRVAVRAPSGSSSAGVLVLESAAVCTSGDYLRFVEVQGKRYGHIIDPRSGRPVEKTVSVTVLARDAMTADALATTISVIGPQDGIDLVKSLEGVECLVMMRGSGDKPELLRSPGFPGLVQAEQAASETQPAGPGAR